MIDRALSLPACLCTVCFSQSRSSTIILYTDQSGKRYVGLLTFCGVNLLVVSSRLFSYVDLEA